MATHGSEGTVKWLARRPAGPTPAAKVPHTEEASWTGFERGAQPGHVQKKEEKMFILPSFFTFPLRGNER